MNQSREFLLYYARVMLRECRARHHQPAFMAFLLNGAARARREAMQGQADMFANQTKLIHQ